MNCLNVQAFVGKIVCVFGQPKTQVVRVDAGIEDVQRLSWAETGPGCATMITAKKFRIQKSRIPAFVTPSLILGAA